MSSFLRHRSTPTATTNTKSPMATSTAGWIGREESEEVGSGWGKRRGEGGLVSVGLTHAHS